MQNIVVTNKKSKRKAIESFIASRGITAYIILDNSDDLFDSLLIETCNLHVFDYLLDMSLVNTIHDLRDRVNVLQVFVTSTANARPYLTLTDDVFVMPEEYDIMQFFWDSPVCNAQNVLAFESANRKPVQVSLPLDLGATKRLAVEVKTSEVSLTYETPDGDAKKTKGVQIEVFSKAKAADLSDKLKVRHQEGIYDTNTFSSPSVSEPKVVHESKSLIDPEPAVEHKPTTESLTEPAALLEPTLEALPKPLAESEPVNEPETDVVEPVQETVAEPKPDTTSVFEQVTEQKPEPEIRSKPKFRFGFRSKSKPEPKPKPEPAVPKAYESFGSFTGGNISLGSGARKARKRTLTVTYDTIASYCLANGFISHQDHDVLMEELKDKPSKNMLFGDIALERNLITDEQLISAIGAVMNIGVMSWAEVKDIKPDYSMLLRERCQKYKLFKADNSTVPGADEDMDILIATTSLINGADEMSRMFEQPIFRYTLDKYIKRKLEEE